MHPEDLFNWEREDVDNLKIAFSECLRNGASERYPNMFQETFVYDKDISMPHHDILMLVIDFGGSTLKLGLYQLKNSKFIENMLPKRINIPDKEEIKDIDAFDWVATQVDEYVGKTDKKILAGLTFSYPVKQTSIKSGRILSLMKNFHFKVDHLEIDPVEEMNLALEKKGLDISVCALSNDTVATLMSVTEFKNDHKIGIVLGTGTNAAYFRKEKNGTYQAINMEWASFDSHRIKRNIYDVQFEEDLHSQKNRTAFLDRMIGGYGFVPLLNMALKDMGISDKGLTMDQIEKIINEANENSEEFKLIKSIKTRTARILTGLLLGFIENMNVKPSEYVTLILNGTIFVQEFDFESFKEEMFRFLNLTNLTPQQLRFVIPKDASLRGMVHIIMSDVL